MKICIDKPYTGSLWSTALQGILPLHTFRWVIQANSLVHMAWVFSLHKCSYFKICNKVVICKYMPSIAQLVERWTVVGSRKQISIGHWFESGSKDPLFFFHFLYEFLENFWFVISSKKQLSIYSTANNPLIIMCFLIHTSTGKEKHILRRVTCCHTHLNTFKKHDVIVKHSLFKNFLNT